ncbi:MAG: NADH-quinone oxidoreductase subunit A [Actinomycetaceae bacterium]|nr:NADH-quinone oxidoreductase subunit A [Actinomycetaceae bacterium]
MSPYVSLLIMLAAALVIALSGLAVSAIMGPFKPNRTKVQTYECGIDPTPARASGARFPVKYYLTAMTFIVFDIEVVFLYPWAVSFSSLSWFGLIAMMTFVFLITVPFVYEWRRGGLDWT